MKYLFKIPLFFLELILFFMLLPIMLLFFPLYLVNWCENLVEDIDDIKQYLDAKIESLKEEEN